MGQYDQFIELYNGKDCYPGYPEKDKRKQLTLAEFEAWERDGRPANVIPELMDHPKYLKGLSEGWTMWDDGVQDFFRRKFAPSFCGRYLRDKRGRPLIPCYREMLLETYAVGGMAYHGVYGPNLCADPVVIGCGEDGYLYIVLIRRGDTGKWALPGGHRDLLKAEPFLVYENPTMCAWREFTEETGQKILDDHLLFVAKVAEGLVPDARTSIHAWRESTAVLFALHGGVIDKFVVRGCTDAVEAKVMRVDEQMYDMIASGHRAYVQKAVEVYEDRFEVLVCTDGHVDCNQD